MRLTLWAPSARSADVVLQDGTRIAMRSSDDGDWACDDDRLRAGMRYRLSIDDGEALPDPRSGSQPEGIDQASEIDDPSSFAWTDSGFIVPALRDLIIYELHVGTFTEIGTFDTAIEHLDDLVALGINAIELMPVAEFSGQRGWGYDGVHLFAPHHAYGGPDGLRRLVDAAHARGLAVILDVVYNHLGPAGNHLPRFAPYFTDRHHTPWGDAIDVENPGVRRFIVDNALHWRDHFHIDGLRLDAVHAIIDDSPAHILTELAERVKPMVLIAEDESNRALDRGVDAQWADELHHAIHVALTGERLGYYAAFTGIDDIVRMLHEPFLGVATPGAHVVCTQNHDQIGNRACGERLEHLVGAARARLAALIVLTSPYVPLVFQGEEWAASTPFQYFTDHSGDLGRAVSRGRRQEFAAFGWKPDEVPDPQAPQTFTRSRLRWSERVEPEHADMLQWYRALIHLRRTVPDLGAGDPRQSQVSRQQDAVIIVRGDHLIAANFGEREITLESPWPGDPVRVLLGVADVRGDVLALPAVSGVICRRGAAGD